MTQPFKGSRIEVLDRGAWKGATVTQLRKADGYCLAVIDGETRTRECDYASQGLTWRWPEGA